VSESTATPKAQNPSENDALKRAAWAWLERGFSIIPVDIHKRPTIRRWSWYQDLPPSHEQVFWWFCSARVSGLAVICGAVSGNLVVLDFDDPADYLDFVVTHFDLADTYTVRTGRGFHVYFYCEELPPSRDLGWCEVKSTGRYVVAPPSHHASGSRYAVAVREPIKYVTSLDDVLVPADAPAVEEADTSSGQPIPATGNPNPGLSAAIADELRARGWRESGDWLNGRCANPAHDDQHPSGGFCERSGVYHCFACGSHRLKDVTAWLGIESGDGWRVSPDEGWESAEEPAAHPNLILKYPDKRAAPLLLLVDAWLTAGGQLAPRLDELVRWGLLQGWRFSEGRLRYLVRHYGRLLHVKIEGATIQLPSLEELSRRFIGRCGPGPAYTLPPGIDLSTRGGGAQMRSWLFFADRQGRPTPSRYAARRLGYLAHQSPINHAQNPAVEVVKGGRLYFSQEEATTIDVGGRFCLWRATLADGTSRHFAADAEAKRMPPEEALAWVGERLARLVMIVVEADRYVVQTVTQMSQIRQNPLQYWGGEWALVCLEAGLVWPVDVVGAVDGICDARFLSVLAARGGTGGNGLLVDRLGQAGCVRPAETRLC